MASSFREAFPISSDAELGAAATAAERCPSNRAALRLMPDLPVTDQRETLDFLQRCNLPLANVLLALLDQSEDCIKLLDTNGGLAFMNCNGRAAMQIADFDEVRGRPWRDFWPDDGRVKVDAGLARARLGTSSRFIADCSTATGRWLRWEVAISPIRDDRGACLAILATSRALSPDERAGRR